MEIEYNDGMGSRGRYPHLFIVHLGSICEFKGQNIPGVLTVRKSQYKKNGKWSSTTYTLALAEGAVPHAWRDGWEEGTLEEGLGVWTATEFAGMLSISEEVARDFLASSWPKTFARMTDREKPV